jgi:hypothetical protein
LANDESILSVQSELVYRAYKNHLCPRLNIRGHSCSGKTVLRSYSLEKRRGTIERIFIGCERYQGREQGHMNFSIGKVDISKLFHLFGRDRVRVHQDIIDAIKFSWDEQENDIFKFFSLIII